MSPFVFAPFSFLSDHVSDKVWWLGTQRGQATGSTGERIQICREEDGGFPEGVMQEHHVLVETDQRK